jgi:hypothetical protein
LSFTAAYPRSSAASTLSRYRQIEGTPYAAGLQRVEALTARLAATHGAALVGSFDPAVAGCTAAMYIDAEHSSPACLKRLIDLVPGL